MLRIIIIITLIGTIIIIGQIVVKNIKLYINDASIIMSGINPPAVRKFIIDDFNNNVTDASMQLSSDYPVSLIGAYLNTDGDIDLIATIDSPQTCGTGGCIPTLLIKSDRGEFEKVPFGYAVKTIEAAESTTNGMHNLKINGDSKNQMIWDGERYTLNNF